MSTDWCRPSDRFGRKFTAATGIQVQVEVNGELHVNDRLATEVFHIVAEGLSNIRRHTLATTASITLVQENSYLSVQICNDGVEGETFRCPLHPVPSPNAPWPLAGRYVLSVRVQTHVAVIAEIPLEEQSHALGQWQGASVPVNHPTLKDRRPRPFPIRASRSAS